MTRPVNNLQRGPDYVNHPLTTTPAGPPARDPEGGPPGRGALRREPEAFCQNTRCRWFRVERLAHWHDGNALVIPLDYE